MPALMAGTLLRCREENSALFSGPASYCSAGANRYNVASTRAKCREGPSMEKWLCWGAMGIAGCMLTLFVLDLVTTWPFGGLSRLVDILAVIACALVGFLGWDASRDLR
jgi:hypothetical protein